MRVLPSGVSFVSMLPEVSNTMYTCSAPRTLSTKVTAFAGAKQVAFSAIAAEAALTGFWIQLNCVLSVFQSETLPPYSQ